jgi:hypothetical protein
MVKLYLYFPIHIHGMVLCKTRDNFTFTTLCPGCSVIDQKESFAAMLGIMIGPEKHVSW